MGFRYAPSTTGYVYMTASQKRGTIYIGVTSDLGRRIPEHKSGEGSRFTGKYRVTRLVWYEEHFDIRDAIQREKSLKRWRRDWKFILITRREDAPVSFHLYLNVQIAALLLLSSLVVIS